jgi:hypothetical protein
MEIVQTEGGRSVKRMVDFYNLDAIIAVGYDVLYLNIAAMPPSASS